MPAKPRLLVIDDKANILKMIRRLFGSDYELTTAESGRDGLEQLRSDRFDVVLTDMRMPDLDGMEILKSVKKERPDTEVVIMTAYADVAQAVEAMKQGAYDYVRKPFEPDELQMILDKAVERRRLREQTSILREQVEARHGFANIVGESRPMKDALELAGKAARSDATVLLTGESGTGKEVFARAIHLASPRSGGRFVAINCGAMPKELIESELFGHVRGAFSGATQSKAGLFEEADGGTMFLDEISELSPELQIKINRAIQEREIRRVGDTRDRKVDVRILAATNRDLRDAIREGGFREDLYYRLNVFPLHLPPLREREGDIPLLVQHFLKQIAGEQADEYRIDPAAMRLLQQQSWPGNVRELRNAIERAVVLAEDGRITPEMFDLPESAGRADHALLQGLTEQPYKEAVAEASRRAQQAYVEGVLRRFRGNVTRAAQHAGIERESFHRLMRKLDIQSEEYRD
jgi:two-component system response regulator HydG